MDCPKRSALAGLPDEAMLEILARTLFRSVCRSKCVAKSWRDLIDDPLNRRRLPQTLQGFFHMFLPMCYRDGMGSDMDHFFIKYLESPLPLDIDPCLSFLMKLLETESVDFLDSCNGLFLFEHHLKSDTYDLLSYIVCNPATKHWGTVPVCARCLPPKGFKLVYTYLAFDPAVSSHFHLIQFWGDEKALMLLSAHTYSSETGVWSHSQSDRTEQDQLEAWRHPMVYVCGGRQAFLNGNLHLVAFHSGQERIIAVDVHGKTKSIITMPAVVEGRRWRSSPYIGQSQGRLHYINGDSAHPCELSSYQVQVSIWVLQDYDTQKWVLKDTVSFLKLLGRRTVDWRVFRIVAIHPDRNVVFFLYFFGETDSI